MTFEQFAQAHGLILLGPRADGRWHRVPTEDKPRKRNGAYVWNGTSGAVRNWATMLDFALYRPNRPLTKVERRQVQQMLRREAHLQALTQVQAAQLAADMVKRATRLAPRPAQPWRRAPSILAHPYLTRKGFPEQPGLVLNEQLLVPMYDADEGTLVGVQTISEDGTKKFLRGQRAKGAVHRIGRARERWLVEGYATGLSVAAALKALRRPAEVMVCFSAGNLVEVARHGTHVFADHDASGAGQQAAQRTGLPWAMSPTVGDANDLHLAEGLEAVCELMREL